jgi:hypothetical protein
MNGEDSSNVFFQYFPKVFTNSYQGSLTSDSKSILKLFKKARKSIENNSMKNEIIQAIFFDELGLAEISKNNPLKVIHSELEYDENKDKVAFLGISNWPLDASKMNRGICLSICESDKNDLIKTAIEIAKSYDLRLIQDYKQYFEYLALTHFDFKCSLFGKSTEVLCLKIITPHQNICTQCLYTNICTFEHLYTNVYNSIIYNSPEVETIQTPIK